MELQRLSAFINQPTELACQLVQKIGGQGKSFGFVDGQYALCLDRLPRDMTDCLVYSFGVSKDWSFDDAMHGAGCEVHSFDPSIGLPDHKRGARHWFHNWGLATSDAKVEPGWDLSTYRDIRRRLGHDSRQVGLQIKLTVVINIYIN